MTYLKPADPNELVVTKDSPIHACPFSPGYPVMEVEDDEISLIDLLITLLRYKKLIIAITCIAGLIWFWPAVSAGKIFTGPRQLLYRNKEGSLHLAVSIIAA